MFLCVCICTDIITYMCSMCKHAPVDEVGLLELGSLAIMSCLIEAKSSEYT